MPPPSTTTTTTSSPAPTLVWRFDPLPDFLADPSLTGGAEPQRLEEFTARWVQFISSLWSWADRGTFALRYVARDGRVSAYIAALAHDPAQAGQLESEIGVLLRTYKLVANSRAARTDAGAFAADSALPRMALVRIRQHVTRSLWKPQTHSLGPWVAGRLAALPPQEVETPAVIFPWAGPSGPFLVPMESLLSQPVACSVTVLVQPTRLAPLEMEWLVSMSQAAQSRAEQNVQTMGAGASVKISDPAAALAGRLYSNALSRLTAAPFLATAYCAAADDRVDTALGLAGAMRSLVFTPHAKGGGSEQPLPTGADVTVVGRADAASRGQYDALAFPPAGDRDLSRFADLVDARGAATLFRVPASVRGGVPGLRVRQQPPDFHPGPRETVRPKDHIQLGLYYAGGIATMPVNDLRKHALVTGFTGSGKTVTVLQLVHQLWADHDVPFLVLESAKQEYRGLVAVDAIARKAAGGKAPGVRVYTLGNELCAPFRLNPFELLPGVRVEAHMGKLQSCFEGAIPPIGPSSSVIAEALLRAYEKAGWCLTDVYPKSGRSRRRFPVLSDFVREVEWVLESRGYEGEVASNLRAALVGRFRPLLIGGKGRMFDTQQCDPAPADLFRTPTILEMNDLVVDDKALVVMFLLTMLREHREIDKSQHGELKHVTVVEEAHNVLEEVGSVGSGEGATKADTRHKAVQAFCSLLTEVRSLGEGLIIADQSPQKLAKDAIRNTNLQLAHQLRDSEDRGSIARAMIMEKEQQDFLGKLPPGKAALFRTGLEKATFLSVEPYYPEPAQLSKAASPADVDALRRQYRGYGFNPLIDDDALKAYMDRVDVTLPKRRRLSLPYLGCEACQSQCAHRDRLFPAVESFAQRDKVDDWYALATDAERRDAEGVTTDQMWLRGCALAGALVKHAGGAPTPDAGWCALLHLWGDRLAADGNTEEEAGLPVEGREFFDRIWPTAPK